MACQRHYDPSIQGFASVPWTRLDLKNHFLLYQEAEMYLATDVASAQQSTVASEAEAKKMSERLHGKAEHLQVELYVAKVKLFGSNRAVNLLSVRELACGADPKPDVKVSRLFVLNEDMTRIDKRLQKRFHGGWYNNATVELFDGEAYLENYVPEDGWGNLFSGDGTLSVSQYSEGSFSPVCKITFEPAGAETHSR